jgi:hypothetical protein
VWCGIPRGPVPPPTPHFHAPSLTLPPTPFEEFGFRLRGRAYPSNIHRLGIGTKKTQHTCKPCFLFWKNREYTRISLPTCSSSFIDVLQYSRARARGRQGRGKEGSTTTPNSRKPNVTGESFASSWVVNRNSFPVHFLILWCTTRGSIVMYACVYG